MWRFIDHHRQGVPQQQQGRNNNHNATASVHRMRDAPVREEQRLEHKQRRRGDHHRETQLLEVSHAIPDHVQAQHALQVRMLSL
jgi:hypothetical protein